MRSTFVAQAVSLLSVLLFGSTAFAAWPPLDDVPTVDATGSSDVAVIVAVDDYLLLPDVTGAVENANDWELFLRRGLRVPTVHVLANHDASREGMLKFARMAAADVREGGTIWWIFIGHGAPAVDGEDGLLVGVDAQQSVESLEARSVRQRELLEVLESADGNTIMVVDACFSGRSPDGTALASGVQPVVAVNPTGSLGPGSLVLSAAKATEVAGRLPGASRPAFSYLVLGAMRGWADDGDGVVTAEEALHYVRRKLRGVKGRQQTPQASGDLSLVLSRGVDESQPAVVAVGDPTACGEGEVERDGECVTVEEPGPATTEQSEAEATLEYLKRRVVFDGRTPQQAGRVLDGPAFYHAIGRPDLAAKWKGNNPYLWLSGMGLVAGGATLFVAGISAGSSFDRSKRGLLLAGVLGGFFTMSAGITLITFGFIADHHPMSLGERRSAAESYNAKLREERGLGPEADSENRPAGRSRSGPFSSNGSATPRLFGVTVQF